MRDFETDAQDAITAQKPLRRHASRISQDLERFDAQLQHTGGTSHLYIRNNTSELRIQDEGRNHQSR